MNALRILAAATALAACGGGHPDVCTQARDLDLARASRQLEDGLAKAPPAMRDKLRAQGERELDLERARFVDVCRRQPHVDLACYRDPARADTAACRDVARAIWEGINEAP